MSLWTATANSLDQPSKSLISRVGDEAGTVSKEVAKRLYNGRGNSTPRNPGTAIEYSPKRYVYLCQES